VEKTSETAKRIGLMGGTFDPIHYGHLVLAEEIRTKFQLDKIIFIPVGTAPHKKNEGVTDKWLRYSMTLLATITNPNFEVSKIEIEKYEISYSIDTVKEIKSMYSPEDEIFFITGADAILDIDSWKDYNELLKLCTFIGANRPGINEDMLVKGIEEIKTKYDCNVMITTVPSIAISSTDIRNRVKTGRSIKYLLPESIENFIYINGLYQG
jgi:nicotinate-nucleotide adenylyltransferase